MPDYCPHYGYYSMRDFSEIEKFSAFLLIKERQKAKTIIMGLCHSTYPHLSLPILLNNSKISYPL